LGRKFVHPHSGICRCGEGGRGTRKISRKRYLEYPKSGGRQRPAKPIRWFKTKKARKIPSPLGRAVRNCLGVKGKVQEGAGKLGEMAPYF